MFNLTGSEIVVILLLALVVLGPEKLPDAVRRFGRTYAELKKMGTGFQQEFKAAIDEPVREMRETANLLRSAATDVASDASKAVKADKPVSPGGPTDQRPDVRAADDPPHPDPAAAELPFADTTVADTTMPDTTVADTTISDTTPEADAPERPPGPAFHSAAPPPSEPARVDDQPDLEQDGEARAT